MVEPHPPTTAQTSPELLLDPTISALLDQAVRDAADGKCVAVVGGTTSEVASDSLRLGLPRTTDAVQATPNTNACSGRRAVRPASATRACRGGLVRKRPPFRILQVVNHPAATASTALPTVLPGC